MKWIFLLMLNFHCRSIENEVNNLKSEIRELDMQNLKIKRMYQLDQKVETLILKEPINYRAA